MGSEHGGLNYRELRKEGINPDDVTDFSVSVNPDPLPDGVLRAVRDSRITRYPDTDCSLLREIIGAYYAVPEDHILIVNGTSQGMFLIASALLPSDGRAAFVGPSYGEYRDACSLKTGRIHEIRMNREEDFAFPVEKIIDHLESERPHLLWICSPNNPTGSWLDEASFERIRRACGESETLFILDEAYACFVNEGLRYDSLRDGVILMRSMTKDFSIPGLRLGYLMARPELIEAIKRWQPDWSVSAPAQDAGAAGFGGIEHFQSSWERSARRRESLRSALEDLGLKVYESCANFFLMEVDDVDELKRFLWKDLILVRDCRSFGLPGTIRLGVRSTEDNDKLISCIREYLNR
jgi:histidinol-phosphate/aromatic aminotransferase/cobyric acid decarboxylase-like protein